MSNQPVTSHPGPVELYILAAGLLLGVLLGPAVLGRVAPTTHASLFGGGPATQQLIDYDEETAAMVAALQATGVTPAAVDEQTDARELVRAHFQSGANAMMDARAFNYITILGLALTLWFSAQAILGRGGRLWSAVSFALVAIGLAVVAARPSMLSQSLLWPWA